MPETLKKPGPQTPAPGTKDFRETTRLEQQDRPATKGDRPFKETTALDRDQHEG